GTAEFAQCLWHQHHGVFAAELPQPRGLQFRAVAQARAQLRRRPGRDVRDARGTERASGTQRGGGAMRDLLMLGYVLVWPVIVLVMMFVMGRGVWRDLRRARRRGEDVV